MVYVDKKHILLYKIICETSNILYSAVDGSLNMERIFQRYTESMLPGEVLYQKYAKGYLDCVYDMNYDVAVSPENCHGLTADETLECFAEFRSIILSIFNDMTNMNYDFYISKDETDRDTILYPIKSIFAILYVIGASGTFVDEKILVNSTLFKELLKKINRKYINTAISILEDYGFFFDGNMWGKIGEFAVYYPDNNKVLYGLSSFTQTISLKIKSILNIPMRFLLMDSRLYSYSIKEKKHFDHLQELYRFVDSKNERMAIQLLHDRLIEHNLSHGGLKVDYFNSDDMNPGAYLRYEVAQFEPRVVIRANAKNKICRLGIWLKNLSEQSDFIQDCSNDFRESCAILFEDCKIDLCEKKSKRANKCKGRLIFSINNIIYEKCTLNTSWGYIGNYAVFKLDKSEIDTYLRFIKLFDDGIISK